MKRIALFSCLMAAVIVTAAFHGCAKREGGQVAVPTPVGPPPQPPAGTQLASIAISGDVHTVLNGQLGAANYAELKPADLIAALGSGTLGGKDLTGDMIVFGDKACVRVPDESAGYPTMCDPMGVKCPFAVAISKGQRPTDLVHNPAERQRTMEELLKDLTAKYRVPVAVYGIGQFSTAEGMALKQAPMSGESILSEEGRAKYLLPPIKEERVVIVFFGVAASEHASHWSPGKELFEKVIYESAGEKGDGLGYHVHAAVIEAIDQDPATLDFTSFFAAARSAQVKEVFHLAGGSRLLSGSVLVYALGGVEEPPKIGIEVQGGVGMLMPVGR